MHSNIVFKHPAVELDLTMQLHSKPLDPTAPSRSRENLPNWISVLPNPDIAVSDSNSISAPATSCRNPTHQKFIRKAAMRETAIPASGDRPPRPNTKAARSSLPHAQDTKPAVPGVPQSGPPRTFNSHRPAHAPSRQRQPLTAIADNAHQHKLPVSFPVKPLSHSQNGRTCTQSRVPPQRPLRTNTTKITTAERVYRRPFATHPDRTAALWRRVRDTKVYQIGPVTREQAHKTGPGARDLDTGVAPSDPIPRSRIPRGGAGKKNAKSRSIAGINDDGELSDVRSTVPTSAPSFSNKSEITRKSGTTGAERSTVTARNPQFEDKVLVPCNIYIHGGEQTDPGPHEHFGTEPAPEGEKIVYRDLEGLHEAQVWVSIDENRIPEIVEDYKEMTNKNVCEQEFASFATETFLKRQRRFVKLPEDRLWRAERMVHLIAPPEEDACWDAPPSFSSGSIAYNFDIRPDCSYWLSLAGFNPNYASELSSNVYVHKDWITCAYFTIEFKKHGGSPEQARAHAAAAGALALYNRHKLKSKALECSKRDWAEADTDHLRHYALTFVGAAYQLWVLRPELVADSSGSLEWNGCTMRLLYKSRLSAALGIMQLESWINEIHRWGLTRHAFSCRDDVKAILKAKKVRVSAVGIFAPEEHA